MVFVVCRRYGIEVRNFGSSWRDGAAFTALVHGLRPDLVDMSSVLAAQSCGGSSQRRINLERAFTLAEKHLGIPRLLHVAGNNSSRSRSLLPLRLSARVVCLSPTAEEMTAKPTVLE